MPVKQSKWKVVAEFAEVGDPDNAQLSADQEGVQSDYVGLLRRMEEASPAPLSEEVMAQILQAQNDGLDYESAINIVNDYKAGDTVQSQMPSEVPETAVPEIQNPVNQEMMMNENQPLEIDSTIPPNAPPPGTPMKSMAKYVGEHKKNKGKKKKKGDKRHLKGTGPVADKANEVYHAIMRDRDGKGEPTKEEQASAAAIAWSQAKKTMKKKAYFRGEEAQILDSYRGMWGEELVRLSVKGATVDVPRDSIEFVSTETIDPVAQLKEFTSHISEDSDKKSQIQADIANLKIAKDIAYRLVVESNDLSDGEKVEIDAIHVACERRISNLNERLASFMTDADTEYVESLPKYEIGKDMYVSSFSRDNAGWMDEIIEKQAAEAAEIDVEKLANEDPLVFVAGLAEEVVADATIVRSMAIERASSAASPLDEEVKNWVVSTYIENAENARRRRLASVKQAASEQVQDQQKTANAVPDEGLYL